MYSRPTTANGKAAPWRAAGLFNLNISAYIQLNIQAIITGLAVVVEKRER